MTITKPMADEPNSPSPIWLQHYPPGVPATIQQSAWASLQDLFEHSCQKFADKPSFYCLGSTLTFAELEKLIIQFSNYLQVKLKLQKGDRIAIMLPNCLQYPVTLFAAFRAGLTVVNVNPLYTPRELEYQLNDAGVNTIVVLANVAHVLEQVIEHTGVKHVLVTQIGDLLSPARGFLVNMVVRYIKKQCPAWSIPDAITFTEALRFGATTSSAPVSLNRHDIAFLQYTGGTTGVAKGAILTHGNILANITQINEWTKSTFEPGKEIIITALPMYHIFSLTANLLTFFSLGALNVLIINPRNMSHFIRELKKFKFTLITGVNTLFNALLHHPSFSSLDFSQLKFTLGGGMAVQRSVAELWQKVTQSPLYEAYGLTETSPAVSITPFIGAGYHGAVGLALPSTEIKICDDTGAALPIGASGELYVKGPQVMQGYWNKPKETAQALSADGWFKTGDIARLGEQGHIYIVDRKKDMILVSGFNVYPNEIEDVVAHLDDVLEVAAVGVDDEYSGEVVKLFVVRKNNILTEEEILAYCKENLASYKCPKYIEFREHLPKTNVGKILRRALRDASA